MHDPTLIATIAAGFAGAWLLGLLSQRVIRSPIVGYLLAGVAIGPYTPGFTGDLHVAQQLAEVGVILLMFGVGLHFHLKDLIAVKGVAIPGAVGQSAIAVAASIATFAAFGMSVKTGAVIGMAMAVASTVVLIRVLSDSDLLNSSPGHVAVGWLIVEDIFTIILLVLIPVLGGAGSADSDGAGVPETSLWITLGMAMVKLAALVAVVLFAGSRVIPWALVRVARLRSRELFTLTILVFSITIAAASYFFFGASMALGAFLAGMVVAQSPVSHQAAADALPMRDAFAVLFFVSVGMLFDPGFLLRQPLMVVAGLAIVLLVKPLVALLIVAILGQSARTALTVAIGLAQIGEFSFILADLARHHGLMSDDGQNVIVAAAIISITLNPWLFRALPRVETWLKGKPRLWRLLNRQATRRAVLSNSAAVKKISGNENSTTHTSIVVGYGPVGRSVHRLLREAGHHVVVIDLNMDTVSSLNATGSIAIYGDASHEAILQQAGIRTAAHLILTLPQTSDRAAIVAAARTMNQNVRILVRARYLQEREELEQAGATAAVFEEVEAAVALARLVLADTGLHREAADKKIKDIRLRLIMENVSNIGTQRVRSVMVPWSRVRWIPAKAGRTEVLALVAQERFSRWPVVDRDTGRPTGYLLSKDLIASADESDWSQHVRPLKGIGPEDMIESALARMQADKDSVYVVEDHERPVGLITLEDILEQVVGQIEDEYPHEAPVSLADAVANGATLLDLSASTGVEAIRELAAAIPNGSLPGNVDRAEVVRLALEREEQVSTDLGNGVAIPHVRCSALPRPFIVFGRSDAGLLFSPDSTELVRLVFLVATPAEQPEAQLALLSQIAAICRDGSKRDALVRSDSPAEVLLLLNGQPAAT